MRYRKILGSLLIGVVVLTSCGGGSATTSTSERNSGMIAITCHFTERAEVDPIRSGDKGSSVHMHDFFGVTAIDNDTTAQSLVAQSNSCLSNGDRSAYWVPTLFVDGVAREPIDLAVYLSAPFADSEVVAPPNGLEMISYKSAWKCIPDGFVAPQISHCPANAKTRLVLEFPHCWNGESLQFNVDTPHVVSASDECPTSHPVVLPQVQMEVRYDMSDLDDLRGVSFSSGDIASVHGDILFAWKQDVLQRDLRECISRDITCGITWSTEVGA